jgi:hypothetical protein
MSDGPRVLVDLHKGRISVSEAADALEGRNNRSTHLVVVSALVRLVAEEVDLLEVLRGDVLEGVGLVPSVGAVPPSRSRERKGESGKSKGGEVSTLGEKDKVEEGTHKASNEICPPIE